MYILLVLSICVLNVNCAIHLSENCRNFSVEIGYFAALKGEEHNVIISPFEIWSFMFNIVLGVHGSSESQVRIAAILLNKNDESLMKGYRDLRNYIVKLNIPDISVTKKGYIFLDMSFQITSDYYRNVTYDIEILNKVLDLRNLATVRNAINNYLPSSYSSSLTERDIHKSKMVMSFSLNFRGQWERPFNESESTTQSFYDENGKIIGEVVMMHQRNRFALANIREMNAYVLELSLGSRNQYSLLIFLPSPGKTVTEVYKTLINFPVKDIFYKLCNDTEIYGFENIEVKIPRFRLNNNIILNEPLNNMGVYDIFDKEYANFARATRENIFVSTIKHRTDFEVTETGIVSSALTSAVFATETKSNSDPADVTPVFTEPHSVYRINPPGFVVNRPFLYFVMEKSTITIVFSGVYLKPSDH